MKMTTSGYEPRRSLELRPLDLQQNITEDVLAELEPLPGLRTLEG